MSLVLVALLAVAVLLLQDPGRLPRLLDPLGIRLRVAGTPTAMAQSRPTDPGTSAPSKAPSSLRTPAARPGTSPSASSAAGRSAPQRPGSAQRRSHAASAEVTPAPLRTSRSARPATATRSTDATLATETQPARDSRSAQDTESEALPPIRDPEATRLPAAARPDQLARAAGRPFALDPPLLTFGRAAADGLEQRGSAFYPYGTTAAGQYLLHHGIDISNPLGTPILAVAGGEVIYAGEDVAMQAYGPADEPYPKGFYGRLVLLRHDPTLDDAAIYSLYGHLSQTAVVQRQRVAAGQPIGYVGSAGIALGPHLHLEFRVSGNDYLATVNPDLMLRPLAGLGVIVGRVADPAGRPLHGIDVGLYALDAAGGERWLRQTTTYPAERINPIPGLGENFVFGDVEPGRYVVAATPGGGRLDAEVRVEAGRASGILLKR